MSQLVKEFRDFVMRGNILDLAVAVILGVAFGTVVTSFTDGVIMPLIAAIVGEPSFDSLTLSVGDGVVRYGTFLTAAVNFLLIAFVIFLMLKAVSKVQRTKEEPIDTAPAPSDEAVLLTEIRDLLKTPPAPARRGSAAGNK